MHYDAELAKLDKAFGVRIRRSNGTAFTLCGTKDRPFSTRAEAQAAFETFLIKERDELPGEHSFCADWYEQSHPIARMTKS